MKKTHWIILLLIANFSIHANAQPKAVADTVVSRYRQFYLQSFETGPVPPVPALPGPDGRWNDLNYSDDQPTVWQLWDHVKRTRALAIAWSLPSSGHYHEPELIAGIERALADWAAHSYQNSNWWFNQIGIPQVIRDILCLLGNQLSKQGFEDGMSILAQLKIEGTGANLIWNADLGIHYYALKNDLDSMRFCRDTLLSIVKITTEEGIQPDYSFHQHGARLQVYHYGGAFLKENVRLAWQLRNTPLAFPENKLIVLRNFVLNGWQWMARGITTVPGTVDRAASRAHNLHAPDIRYLVPYLIAMDPAMTKEYLALKDFQNGKSFLNGYRYYPRSDFTAWQQPAFSFFLKTNSSRTLLTESINQENLKGGLLDNGDGYLMANGNEYYDLMPVWDWNALPGQLNFVSDTTRTILTGNYSGNVSNGSAGIASMANGLAAGRDTVRSKKSWFSFDQSLIVLTWVDSSASLPDSIYSVADQCRLQTSVCSSTSKNFLDPGNYLFRNREAVAQSNFVYQPLYQQTATLYFGKKTGDWYSINHSEADTIVTDSVFLFKIWHGSGPSGYLVQYNEKLNTKISTDWKILSNTAGCQAIEFGKKQSWAASFYKPGTYRLSKRLTVTINRSCMILFDGETLFASDPLHKGGKLTVRLNNKTHEAELPDNGNTIRI